MATTRTVVVAAVLLASGHGVLAQNETVFRAFDPQHNFIAGSDSGWAIESPSSTLTAPKVASPQAVEGEPSPLKAHVVERAEHENRVWATLGAKLNKLVTLNAPHATQRQAMSEIARQIQAPVRFDERALEEEGLTLEEDVGPLALYNVPADGAAQNLLRDRDLELIVDGDSLLVTTAARAEELLVTRVYDVGDLADSTTEEERLRVRQELMNAIQRSTSGLWLDVDGAGGVISPCLSGGSNAFVIRQSFKVHREIEKLLYDLRKVRGIQRR